MRENETRNFWLQMVNDFYDSDRMIYLESRPHGQEYCLLYTKLLLKSVKTGGVLRLSEKLVYTHEMIASITRMPVEIVREGMELLEGLDLVEIWEDGTIFLPELEDMVGSETVWAGKKRRTREKKQSGGDNVLDERGQREDNVPDEEGQDEDNVPLNKRKENNNKTNDIKEENKKENAPGARTRTRSSVKSDVKKTYGSYGWVELTEAEHTQLLGELGETELARCISYIDESAQSTGNRNRWQDWALILRRCSREQWGIRQEKSAYRQQTGTIGYHTEEEEYNDCGKPEASVTELERMRAYLAKLKERDSA